MIQPLFVFSDFGLLILRGALGLILLAHGRPKLKDLNETARGFEGMGFRPGKFWATLVALLEVFGGIFLLFGFLTQIVSLLLIIEFAVILLKVKRGQKLVDGYELDLIILASAILLTAMGGGFYALDNYLGIILY